ncbi:TPR-like protein [Amniculicola lignicola CBS 123094]|uniref:TPR-like protein n=1 Tax=Amniculicola lignicola CBS 123094 TaxID=1392246 RepID=A0A6A5W5P3_9PLEO|nr:TPR-like protein [Amniculicola lignicola CBS 123094]
MGDALISFLRASLPEELATLLQDLLHTLENGHYKALLEQEEVQVLLGHQDDESTRGVKSSDFALWSDYVSHRLGLMLAKRTDQSPALSKESSAFRQHLFCLVGVAALYAFLQSTVTGPPLPFDSAETVLPRSVSVDATAVRRVRGELVASLSADGVAAYRLTSNIELLCLAETILVAPPIQKNVGAAVWARLRVHFVHQRLLSEVAPSLQGLVYEGVDALAHTIFSPESKREVEDLRVHFLLERAAIHTHHGFDKKARADLDQATQERKFEFALTGILGKRTKFQENDTSQLVVLARSAGSATENTSTEVSKPKNLDLNDDTLLESISFTEKPSTEIKDESALPVSLTSMDPSNQPLLDPLDSVILLSLASSITNTNPSDGLTREETVPYATRVLEGGSSNWQVYTQALLVRSRIEGYKSRTLERGLLQLQALVDQVIAETSGAETTPNGESNDQVTSFLPKAKDSEAAPVQERIHYLFALASPSRWELEAELAARWVSVGGLRSALEIYERLEMWAEAALCWAATEKEDKARRIIRKQLFHATSGNDSAADPESETWEGPPRDPPPAEAPRLYCILGDIGSDTSMYETAWTVSGNRYARAQRSLGRQYFTAHKYEEAAEAYRLSLKINALNHSSWFALGCAYLELKQFKKAVEAFSRCVQLDEQDAEAWSNLAAALLHLRPKTQTSTTNGEGEGDAEMGEERRITSHPRQDALKAFKRAATLKHDNARIWSNVLAVSASTTPPSYPDIITAQRRLCEIRGASEGEKCIDVEILELLVKHVVSEFPSPEFSIDSHGLPRMLNELIEKHIKPLITASPELWRVLATYYLHTSRPSSSLAAHESAWRILLSQPAWSSSTDSTLWDRIVDQTIDLVDAYESLGPRERTEGLAAGTGELVAKDWRFKARSAVRSVLGKGRENWEGSGGWERLEERAGALKGRE